MPRRSVCINQVATLGSRLCSREFNVYEKTWRMNYKTIFEKGSRWHLFPRPGHFHANWAPSLRGMSGAGSLLTMAVTNGKHWISAGLQPILLMFTLIFWSPVDLQNCCWRKGRLDDVVMETNLENATLSERNQTHKSHLLCNPSHKNCLDWVTYNDGKWVS